MNKVLSFLLFLFIFSSCSHSKINHNFNPEAVRLNDEAFELGRLMKYDSALLVYDQAIALDSSYYIAYGNKAAIYSAMEDFKSALLVVEEQVRVKPDFAEGWVSAATLADKMHDSIKAKSYYKTSLDLYNTRIADPEKKAFLIENRINRDFLLIQLGQVEEAHKDLEAIKADYPEIKTINTFLNMTRASFLKSLEIKKR